LIARNVNQMCHLRRTTQRFQHVRMKTGARRVNDGHHALLWLSYIKCNYDYYCL